MSRRGVGADHSANLFAQGVVQRHAITQTHEQHHAHIALPILANDDGLQHLRHLFHLAIDLCGADAYATRVEHGVGAAVDDQAAMSGFLGIIAVGPDAGERGEIGSAEFLAICVVPEAHRY